MNTQKIITTKQDFLEELLRRNSGTGSHDTPLVVQQHITIHADDLKDYEDTRLSFKNIVFTNTVNIQNISKPNFILCFEDVNFTNGLWIENCQVCNICIYGTVAEYIRFTRSSTSYLNLLAVQILGALRIGGLQITGPEILNLLSVTLSVLDLKNSSNEKPFVVSGVETDNVAMAVQLRLLGIPVHISTKKVTAELVELFTTIISTPKKSLF